MVDPSIVTQDSGSCGGLCTSTNPLITITKSIPQSNVIKTRLESAKPIGPTDSKVVSVRFKVTM
jgi:hypothetical protein